ncbi:hypothetical protein CTheo_4629 [Ceratobasidium theobromae]|uniref:WW domain-containing protein n=1 Tax=Ceratobasidium theobromae TaxID=1582974 RepID=A0A5N5QKE8_9AGAM|nr:hypothetical protein CTheo_4629 [Ceratobasidium theobromae]
MSDLVKDVAPLPPNATEETNVERAAEGEERSAEERSADPQQDGNAESSGSEEDKDEGEKEEKDQDKVGEQQEEGNANPPLPDEPVPDQMEWQAIWSPAHNAYYFYNIRTAETTWVNPLDPASSASSSTQQQQSTGQQVSTEQSQGMEQAPPDMSHLNGIDPELAFLDPTLAVPSAGATGPVPMFSARFGARSGKFTAMDGRTPEHMSEAARAQRMSSVYFDTQAWENEIAARDAQARADQAAGLAPKRKRVTKADIERFKAQKKARQTLRNAWLRE